MAGRGIRSSLAFLSGNRVDGLREGERWGTDFLCWDRLVASSGLSPGAGVMASLGEVWFGLDCGSILHFFFCRFWSSSVYF